MTPLTVIKTSAYLARNIQDNKRRAQKLNEIDAQVSRLQSMIEEMITVTKLDVLTPATLIREQVNITKLIQEQINNYRSDMNGHTLTVDLRAENSVYSLNSEYMKLAISKLLENAIQYTSKEGNIQITLYLEDESVKISVTDDGIGISDNHLPHIFDRFYRIQNHRPTDGGSGLGLTIVKAIVELHRGQVQVASTEGEGSTFRIILPIHS